MEKLKIYMVPHPKLRQKAAPVDVIDDDVCRLLDNMLHTMYADNGMGLAAPQVGIAKRVIVMDAAEEGEQPDPLFIINPKIIWRSDDEVILSEACISIPGVYGDVRRPREVEVEYLDRHNRTQCIRADGYKGRCFQHEIDHLDGLTFLDHLPPLKRKLLLNKSIRYQKNLQRTAEK